MQFENDLFIILSDYNHKMNDAFKDRFLMSNNSGNSRYFFNGPSACLRLLIYFIGYIYHDIVKKNSKWQPIFFLKSSWNINIFVRNLYWNQYLWNYSNFNTKPQKKHPLFSTLPPISKSKKTHFTSKSYGIYPRICFSHKCRVDFFIENRLIRLVQRRTRVTEAQQPSSLHKLEST